MSVLSPQGWVSKSYASLNWSQHPFCSKVCPGVLSLECFLRFDSLVVGVLGTVGTE